MHNLLHSFGVIFKKGLGSKVNISTAFHTWKYGQEEHTIHTLDDILMACVIDFKGYRDDHLPLIESLAI